MEKKFRSILLVSITLIMVATLVLTFSSLTAKKASADECPQNHVLCDGRCYNAPYCYSCEIVEDCDESGFECEEELETYKCNAGGGGGGPHTNDHYCYCNTINEP